MTFYSPNTAAPSSDFPGFTVAESGLTENWAGELTKNGLVSGATAVAGNTFFRTSDADGHTLTYFVGTGITTSGGNVTGGTINSIYRYDLNTGHWTGEGITGLSMSAATYWNDLVGVNGTFAWDNAIMNGSNLFFLDQTQLSNAGPGYALDAGNGGGTKHIDVFGATTDAITYKFNADGTIALNDTTTGRNIALTNFNYYEGDAGPDVFQFSKQISGTNTLEGQLATHSGIADMNFSIAGGSGATLDLSQQALEGFGTAEFTDTRTGSGTAAATMFLNANQFSSSNPAAITPNLAVKGDAAGVNDTLQIQMPTASQFFANGFTFDANWNSNPNDTLVINGLGNSNNLYIIGTNTREQIYGGTGNDFIYGETGTGTSTIQGGGGNDVIESNTTVGGTSNMFGGGSGFTYLIGGAGTDNMNANTTSTSAVDVMEGGTGATNMSGGSGTNYFYAGSGATSMVGGNGENIYILGPTASAADTIDGLSGNAAGSPNYVYANTDTQSLSFQGGKGTDVFVGGNGASTIEGGGGTLYSFLGTGANVLNVKAGDGVGVVQNFGTNDHVNLAASTGLTNFAQVKAAEFFDAAINTTIITGTDNKTALWLINQAPNQITAGEFSFT
jgi:hypothetical protein